jgi:crotonobetainyl-CoA:carnitine CoA-transferase CaiB-like acyl-CoA transferase
VDPRFATPEARLRHAEELDRVIAGWAGQLTIDEALERLQAADAPAAPVNRMADLFADPHIAVRGSIEPVSDDELGRVAMAAVTPTLSGTPGAIRWAGQPMGSANDAVYGGLLGLDRAALDELRAGQVV